MRVCVGGSGVCRADKRDTAIRRLSCVEKVPAATLTHTVHTQLISNTEQLDSIVVVLTYFTVTVFS